MKFSHLAYFLMTFFLSFFFPYPGLQIYCNITKHCVLETWRNNTDWPVWPEINLPKATCLRICSPKLQNLWIIHNTRCIRDYFFTGRPCGLSEWQGHCFQRCCCCSFIMMNPGPGLNNNCPLSCKTDQQPGDGFTEQLLLRKTRHQDHMLIVNVDDRVCVFACTESVCVLQQALAPGFKEFIKSLICGLGWCTEHVCLCVCVCVMGLEWWKKRGERNLRVERHRQKQMEREREWVRNGFT